MARQDLTRTQSVSALAAVVVGASLVMVPYAALGQGGTSPLTPGVGNSQSGSAIDSTRGADVSTPPSSPQDQRRFDAPFTGQPSGLGEQGSGQSQSTMERSGGQPHGMSQADMQDGKTAEALEQLLQQKEARASSDQEGSSSY